MFYVAVRTYLAQFKNKVEPYLSKKNAKETEIEMKNSVKKMLKNMVLSELHYFQSG